MLFLVTLLLIACVHGATPTPEVEATPGLDAALRLIQEPVPHDGHVRDVILTGIVNQWEAHAYKLQILRQRIGYAWELVFTDFGYERHPAGVDLINRRRRIAIELKNSCRVSSVAKRNAFKMLTEFRRTHPAYTVIFACINYRNLNEGGTTRHGVVQYMKGRSFLTYILGSRKNLIIRRMKTAAQNFVNRNSLL